MNGQRFDFHGHPRRLPLGEILLVSVMICSIVGAVVWGSARTWALRNTSAVCEGKAEQKVSWNEKREH